MEIIASDKAKELLALWEVTPEANGTFTAKSGTITPTGIQLSFDFSKAEELVIRESGENSLYIGYRKGIVETFFEMSLAKNEKGEDTIYFYIPEL